MHNGQEELPKQKIEKSPYLGVDSSVNLDTPITPAEKSPHKDRSVFGTLKSKIEEFKEDLVQSDDFERGNTKE